MFFFVLFANIMSAGQTEHSRSIYKIHRLLKMLDKNKSFGGETQKYPQYDSYHLACRPDKHTILRVVLKLYFKTRLLEYILIRVIL